MNMRNPSLLYWSRATPHNTSHLIASKLYPRWQLDVMQCTASLIMLPMLVLARRPTRLVIFDPLRRTPLWMIRCLAMLLPITVYNEHGDSFDVDKHHEAIVRGYYASYKRPIIPVGRWINSFRILGNALGRLAWGYRPHL